MAKRLTEQELKERALTERDLQRAVGRMFRSVGFFASHHYDSRFSDPGTRGTPDLTVLGHGWFFQVELKARSGHLSDEQIEWATECERARVEYYVAYPKDWDFLVQLAEDRSHMTVPAELRQFPTPARKRRKTKPVSQQAPVEGSAPAKVNARRQPGSTRST